MRLHGIDGSPEDEVALEALIAVILENIHVADYVADIIRSKHFNNPKSTFRKKLFSSGKIKLLSANI